MEASLDEYGEPWEDETDEPSQVDQEKMRCVVVS